MPDTTNKGGADNPTSSTKRPLNKTEAVISEALTHFLEIVAKECIPLNQEHREPKQLILNAMLGAMAALISGLGRFTVQETVQGLRTAAEMFDPTTEFIGKVPAGEALAKRKANWQD